MSIEDIYITALIYIETMAGIEGRLNRANGVKALKGIGVSAKDIEA